MLKKTYIYGGLQLFVVTLTGIYIESISSDKLLFLDEILSENAKNGILNNSFIVFSTLGIINFLIFIFSHVDSTNKEQRNLYNNICQIIFDKYIKPDTNLSNSKFRVSFFMAKKGLILRRIKYFLPEYRRYLINVGRYQTRQETRYCKIKFLPNEGAVGKSYSIGEILFFDTINYTIDNKKSYIEDQIKKLELQSFKVKQLIDKPCSYICCPIKFFTSDRLFGVIVVDCIEPNKLKYEQFRTIEDVISNYSVFFNTKGE